MKPDDVYREVTYPLTDMAIVFAMVFFWVMFMLIHNAGFLGIWLGVLVAPAYFRYLLYLLEARANGKQAPVPTAEMFAPVDNLWTLTPLVLVAVLIWGVILLTSNGYAWLAAPFGLLILIIVPASMGILAITHSPEESLNPAAVVRMIRACGPAYLIIPATILFLTFVFFSLAVFGVPLFLLELGSGYQAVLLFTLTGAVLNANDIAFDVEIEAPLEAGEMEVAEDLEKARQNVASHAYGFISRGNRDGGFAHILDWIGKEADVDVASEWFFRAMMKWESKDAALFFAQIYFAHLLQHDDDARALKLMSICLHQNPDWKPKAQDRPHALALAEKYQRDDLLKSLRN